MEKMEVFIEWLQSENRWGEDSSLADVTVVKYDDSIFEFENEEYIVQDDEGADELFKQYIFSFIDDVGYTGFSEDFQTAIFNDKDFVDEEGLFSEIADSLAESIRESPESYYSFFDLDLLREKIPTLDNYDPDELDLDDEEEVVKFAVSNEILEDSDFIEAAQKYIEDYGVVEYIIDIYGEETAKDIFTPYMNDEAIAQEVEKWDGRGGLASYDGNEIKFKASDGSVWYLYRIS